MTILGNARPLNKNKMSYTNRAVGRERTTTIMEYIDLRPQWSSNMELILSWDVCGQVLDEMKDKCYGADERLARRVAPAG